MDADRLSTSSSADVDRCVGGAVGTLLHLYWVTVLTEDLFVKYVREKIARRFLSVVQPIAVLQLMATPKALCIQNCSWDAQQLLSRHLWAVTELQPCFLINFNVFKSS